MRKLNTILLSAAFLFVLGGCDSSLYPEKYVTNIGEDALWAVPDLAQGVLFNCYYDMPTAPDCYSSNFLDVATDNAVVNNSTGTIYRLSLGRQTPSDNPFSGWSTAYDQFQQVHQFLLHGLSPELQYVEGNEAQDAARKRRLRGEAFYLRAWWGYYLLRHWGGRDAAGNPLGYPIVTSFQTEKMTAVTGNYIRHTYDQCVAQICADCDSASFYLHGVIIPEAEYGRANETMSEFLKARTLFFAASPLYSSAVTVNGMGDYTVTDAALYKTGWERAAVQCQKVLDLCGNPAYVALKNTDLADASATATPAHIIHRNYANNNALEGRHYPPFNYGSCNSGPSQNLVDAYPMKANGYPISDPASGYNPQTPYTGRDNRMAMTVYYNGATFPSSGTQIDITKGGKDSESYVFGDIKGSSTGYYLRKFLSEKVKVTPVNSSKSVHIYPKMRLAEIFLDLAEALNEVAGPDGTVAGAGTRTAYDIIKDIRSKSGGITSDLYIETVRGDKNRFMDLILNERRIEMAFENERYWDLRRRVMDLNEPVRGIRCERDAVGTYTYSEVVLYTPTFKSYYNPVPYDEVKRGLVQNAGF